MGRGEEGGIIAGAEGTSLVGVWGQVKFGGSETLFSALVMRYVCEKIDQKEVLSEKAARCFQCL